jgi:hypothetical protein
VKESKPKIHQTALTFSLLALAISTGTLQADTIKFSPTTIALACNSNSGSAGPGAAQTVNVKPVTALTGSNTILVTAPTLAGVTFSPATQTLAVADNTTGKNFTLVSNDATCATPAATQNIKFKVGASPADDPAVLIVTKSTNPASNLTVPATITLLCGFDGTTRTTGDSQTVMVTSTPSGEGFAPVTTAGLTLGGGGTTPSTFTVKPVCDATYAATQNSTATYTVPLRHSANTTAMNDKNVTVTVKTVPLSKLTVNLLPAALTYVKGSSAPAFKDITVSTSAASTFMTVDTSTLPIWLTVDTTSATIMLGTPKGIRLSTTSVADTMAPGSYSGSVHLKVSGQADQYFPVTLQVNNPAGKLTISEGQTRNDTWTVGSATLPTYYVTMVSSGSAIPYSVDLAGPLQPQVDPNLRKGLAYSFGTKIPVTFKSDVFAAAQAGTTLSGTVSITWGNPSSTTVVTFNITIQSPGSTLISITPAAVPTALPGTSVTLYLTGTGFIASLDPNVQTRVGTWVGNAFVAHSSLSTKVNTPSSITLTITVPAATDTVLPFKDGGIANLAVCNPTTSALGVTTCTAGAGANASFTIGSSPNIQTITSASTFSQVGLGVTQNVAPFDMLSIFGFNFCPSCSSSQVLPGVPDTTSLRYPNFVTPDATAPAKKLQVGCTQKGRRLLSATLRFYLRRTPRSILSFPVRLPPVPSTTSL